MKRIIRGVGSRIKIYQNTFKVLLGILKKIRIIKRMYA